MPNELAGVLVISLIVGLIEVFKRLGMDSKVAPLAAIALGLLIMAGNQAANIAPTFRDWYNVILWGVAAGLMAVGLYSGTKNTLQP